MGEVGVNKETVVQSNSRSFKQGMIAALPIVIGYIPIALTYGLIARQADIPILHIVLMSALVYAGASQFMAVNMLVASAGAIEIIFATFILNLRHFIMGLSLMNVLKKIPFIYKIFASAGMTDETFALMSMNKEACSGTRGHLFTAGLVLASYSSWVLGSLAGCLLADFIPSSISQSMGIALYAMFIGLLIPSVRKQYKVGLIAVVSMLLCYIFSLYVGSGWAIIFATLIGAAFGACIVKEDEL